MDNSTAEVVLLHVGSEKIGVGMLQAGFFFFPSSFCIHWQWIGLKMKSLFCFNTSNLRACHCDQLCEAEPRSTIARLKNLVKFREIRAVKEWQMSRDAEIYA